MWTILSSLGIGLFKVISDIQKEKTVRENAKTEQERTASNERIAILEARKEVILNAKPIDLVVKSLWGLLPLPYFGKIFIYDKFIMADWANGRTDDLSENQWWIVMTVLGGYFLLYTYDKVFKK